MLWVDTATDEEARAVDKAIWDIQVTENPDGSVIGKSSGPVEESGQFWYDELNQQKNDPDKRYAIARRHLPLPAAWREMAVALRTKIRASRKDKGDYQALLQELHHLAAMSSYADYGYIQRVAFRRLAGLDLGYARIGCDALPLLGATDRKWMRELWGEPSTHTTAAVLYADMLAADTQRIKADWERERAQQSERLFQEIRRTPAQLDPAAQTPKRRSLLNWLLGRG